MHHRLVILKKVLETMTSEPVDPQDEQRDNPEDRAKDDVATAADVEIDADLTLDIAEAGTEEAMT